MTAITACPACQTQFEVTDAELQAYGGKVRCGECDHVFDARDYLQAPASADPALPQLIPTSDLAPTTDLTQAASVASAERSLVYDETAEAEQAPAASPAEIMLAAPEPAQEVVIDLTEPVLTIPQAVSETAEPAPFSLQLTTADEDRRLPPQEALPEFLRKVALEGDLPIRQRSPLEHRVMLVSVVVLLLGLLLQSLYFSRTTLAASYPASKPWLLALCKPLHCTLGVPKDLAQLTIDDADMQEHAQHAGALVFSSVLINHGSLPQALPDIEVTLTNTADEPVIRKRLKPVDYWPGNHNADDASEASIAPQQELRIRTLLGVDETLVAGFRVALSY